MSDTMTYRKHHNKTLFTLDGYFARIPYHQGRHGDVGIIATHSMVYY